MFGSESENGIPSEARDFKMPENSESTEGADAAVVEYPEDSDARHFADQGYELMTNVQKGEMQSIRDAQEARGMEVEVAGEAFDADGNKIEGMVGVWVKEAAEKAA